MNNFKIFPRFDLDVLIPEGFTDQSWKNDVCPKWYNEDKDLMLWIDYKDPNMRDFPSSDRFALCSVDSELSHIDSLIESDNYQDILNYLKGDL